MTAVDRNSSRPRHHLLTLSSIFLTTGFASLLPDVAAATKQKDIFCSATASSIYRACGFEVQDDYWLAIAECINAADEEDREECFEETSAAKRGASRLCRAQLSARVEVCGAVGEDRYDPDFDAENFDSDLRHPSNPNRYFPLTIGNKWELRGAGETVKIEVLNQTKLIDDVRCIVFRDRVYVGGQLVEDTDDWFAQALNSDVWYCGEEVKDYETFDGDRPRKPELVSIDGSFKADVDGAKPGIIFLGNPIVGTTYREEFSLNNAEDVSEILSIDYRYGANAELDRFVPRALVTQLCRGDCVVVKAYSAMSPGEIEIKYYAPDIGFFLQVVPESGEVVQLVSCNFDPRCAALPAAQ